MNSQAPIEQIKKGDQMEIWFDGAPRTVNVTGIVDRHHCRILAVSFCGHSFELAVERGQTVNVRRSIAC